METLNEIPMNDETAVEDTTVGNPFQQVDNTEDVSTNGTNNSIGAFMTEKPVLKYKGREVPVDSPDELINLAQKGMSLEVRAAELKPKERLLKIVDGVPAEVLQAVADLHSGKKEAINYLKSQYGIADTSTKDNNGFWDEDNSNDQVSEDPAYTPEVKAEDPIAEFWNEFAANDQVAAANVNNVYSQLDESFKRDIYQPGVFQAFAQSVVSGEFENVYPIAVKEKSLNPAMSWIQAYQLAAQKGNVNTSPNEPPAAATPPKTTDQSRHMSAESAADRVWNDPDYFKKLETEIFGL
jgi:hypothetical protein